MMYTIRVSDGVDKVIAKWKKSNPNLFKKYKKIYPQIRNYAPNMIQKRKESASLVKRGHSASNVTIKTYKCPLPHHAT